MGALLHTLGPTHLYIKGRGQGATVQYLGTAVSSPEVEAMPRVLNVMSDLSGRSLPFVELYDGENHAVSVILNRFDYNVLKLVRNAYRNPGQPLGVDGSFDRGSIIQGSRDFELLLAYEYSGSPNDTGYSPGRSYYSARLANYKETTEGTRVLEAACVFLCQNTFDVPSGQFYLFSEEPEIFANLVPN